MKANRLMPALTVLATGVLGICAGCAPKTAEFEPLRDVPYEIEPWSYRNHPGHVVRSAHYEVFTTLRDEALLAAVPQAMESAFDYYRTIVPSAREPAQRMQVYLFASRGQWSAFTRGRYGRARARQLLKIHNGGYSEGGVAVIEYTSHSSTFAILAHEGFHQYVHCCVDGPLPAWLNEGLAVLCEGQVWGAHELKGFDPWANPYRLNSLTDAMRRDQIFPLSELLETHAGRVVGSSTRRVATYYGQLWALVLFLREGADGKYEPQFTRLLERVGSTNLVQFARAAHVASDQHKFSFGRALFEGFISKDFETVESEFREFVRRRIVERRRR